MGFFVFAALVLLVGCGRADAPRTASPITVVDDAGLTVALAAPAARVVSLVPSVTETVVALGAQTRLVGRTKYDRDPALQSIPDVGGGLDPNIETIAALRPDLVVTYAGDRRADLRERLAALGIPSLTLQLDDTTDAFRSIRLLGQVLALDSTAAALAASIRRDFRAVADAVADRPRPTVFYVVFDDPPMTAGPQTFIGQLIDLAGGTSIFADSPVAWPTVSMEEVVRRAPALLVLPTGEMPSATLERLRRQPGWASLPAVRDGRVQFVDGDLTNRPGARMGEAARALLGALHPELAP